MTAPPFVVYGLVETRHGHRFENQIRYVGQTQDLEKRIAIYRRGQGNCGPNGPRSQRTERSLVGGLKKL